MERIWSSASKLQARVWRSLELAQAMSLVRQPRLRFALRTAASLQSCSWHEFCERSAAWQEANISRVSQSGCVTQFSAAPVRHFPLDSPR